MPDAPGMGGAEARTRGLGIHRRYYASSVLRTLAFYGTVLVLCLLFPIFMALGISLFFLKFYRREIREFLRHPIRALRAQMPPEFQGYSFQVLEPGSLTKSRAREAGR